MSQSSLKSLLGLVAKVNEFAAQLLILIASMGLLMMTGIIGWQVFGRFILNSSPSWTEQAALFLMIWFVSLAAAAGVREGFHIRITALEDAMPFPIRRSMQVIANIVVGLIGLSMAVWGGDLVMRTWDHSIPSLSLSRGLAYLGLPLSGGLILLFSIERVLSALMISSQKLEGEA